MKITKVDKTIEKIKYIIEFEGNELSELKTNAFNTLVKNLNVVGFRKGHVPLDVAKKHISPNDIISQAIDKACKKAHKEIVEPEIINKSNNIYVDTLSYDVDNVKDDIFNITCEFYLFPEVTIPDYKKTNLKFETSSATKDQINKRIDELIKKDTLLVPKDGDTIEKGDTVVFDFKGFVDGKPLEGGEAKLFELEIGSNQFIPGFEEQMIGLKKNTEPSINVVFPKNYHVANLANKQARFELNIRDIKISQKPTIDDQYIATLKIDGVHSKQEFEKYIEKQIEDEQLLSNRQINMSLIYDYIKKHSKLSYLPNFIVEKEIEGIKTMLSNQAQQNHMTLEQFMTNKYHVNDKNDIHKKFEELAKDNVTLIYSLSKIIKELNITINDNDHEHYYQEISNIYHLPIEQIKKMINANQNIDEVILQNKLVDEIIKLNK